MVQRVHFRRRTPYRTPGNLVKIVKTPANRLVYVPRKKVGKAPVCGDCKLTLRGIAARRPAEFARLKKTQRTVARSHGGSLCGNCVQVRILRSFLKEEEALVRNKTTKK